MQEQMKLGSLFDGSGGFPLAGALSGITPVWASEVEPYPIAVTRSRFPMMQHLGSVTEVHGDKVQPVDVITFGSPCQDMSIAGRRAGMKHAEKGDGVTTRSGLFYEAIRIIAEMREATNGQYPKIAVWENDPGAFSSNKGEDFRCVLEALADVRDPGRAIPRPPRGKWSDAGEIVGDGYSIAWRVLDAQYWGVPQRRKRIYLVADFRGGRAGKILFERDGLRGHPAPGGTPGEGAAGDAAGGAGGSGDAERLIYALQSNGIDRADTARCNGCGWREGVCYTLNTIDRPAIAFKPMQSADAHGVGASESATPTLAAQPGGNAVPAVCYPEVFHTLTARNAGNVESAQRANCVCMATGQGGAEITQDMAPTLMCGHEHTIAAYSGKPPRKYIIRRLTPLECCRLQGFPDGWGIPDHKDRLSDEEAAFWQRVRDTCAAIGGKAPKKYSVKALTKWYNGRHTDSAEYKMWGNGIALPCARYVLEGAAEEIEKG